MKLLCELSLLFMLITGLWFQDMVLIILRLVSLVSVFKNLYGSLIYHCVESLCASIGAKSINHPWLPVKTAVIVPHDLMWFCKTSVYSLHYS